MSYNYLAWNPDVEITPAFMKKPASGTSPISGGALLKAGTPLNSSKAVANTSNAKYLVAEDYIFYDDPGQNRDPVKLISAGYVDLAKAQTAWGKSYTDDAIAALGEAGITLVDGATLPIPEPGPSGGGVLVVNITYDDVTGKYVSTETAEEIAAAYESGTLVVGNTSGDEFFILVSRYQGAIIGIYGKSLSISLTGDDSYELIIEAWSMDLESETPVWVSETYYTSVNYDGL